MCKGFVVGGSFVYLRSKVGIVGVGMVEDLGKFFGGRLRWFGDILGGF